MTVKDAAIFLEVSTTVVYGYIAQRRIPHYRLGMGQRGAIRLDLADVTAFKESRRVEALAAFPSRSLPAPPKRSLPSVSDLAALRRAGKL